MTDQIVEDTGPVGPMPKIYNHPKLREMSQSELYDRLQDVRNRRLLAALDYKEAQTLKMLKLGSKLATQWEDTNQKALQKLAKVDEMITALEKLTEKMIGSSHKLKMTEEGIDL